ncbi:MAG: hypothetical protein H6553_14045 [Chitinophagales bacterium]|nr:hypothetical protein [Chitinophagales bacterium]
MRIVGQIDHPFIKITLLQINDKFLIKLEHGLMEQTYKIRICDEIPNTDVVTQLVDETFLGQCIAQFSTMNKALYESMQRHNIV